MSFDVDVTRRLGDVQVGVQHGQQGVDGDLLGRAADQLEVELHHLRAGDLHLVRQRGAGHVADSVPAGDQLPHQRKNREHMAGEGRCHEHYVPAHDEFPLFYIERGRGAAGDHR